MATGLALPYLPQIHGLLSFPVSQVKPNCIIAPSLCSSHLWPRGVPERTGLDFSARVNQGGALFDERKGVSIF